jgi:hypothetical protein
MRGGTSSDHLPCNRDSPGNFWYPWLAARLAGRGYAVEVTHYPGLNVEPIATFLPTVLNGHSFDTETVLVGHSSGAALLLALMEHVEVTVAQAVLVAGYSTRPNTADEPVLQEHYNWTAIRSHAGTALASLHRLADLTPHVLLPAHGPIPADPGAALATALRRAQRLVDDPAGAVWYGTRRIFAFALMIRDGIPVGEVEPYLHARAWLTDAARLLGRTPEALAAELVDTMLRSGAIIVRDGRLRAAADHTPVTAESLRVPFPQAWPDP